MNEAKSKDLLALSKNQPKKIPSQTSFLVRRRWLRELLRTGRSFGYAGASLRMTGAFISEGRRFWQLA
jgi:hypothetical protein